jgi:IS1 family transposase
MPDRSAIIILMNKLPMAKRVAVVSALVEGNSIRSTARMTDVSKPTILKLLADLGRACAKFQGATITGVRARRVQVDEIWQFVYAKAKNVPAEKRGTFGYGDVWTWVAIDADSKLILSWRIGPRDTATAYDLMHDLARRITNRIQLTTDGYKVYLEAVESAFNLDIDYAMLTKIYGADPNAEKRYSPAKIQSMTSEVITGDPNPKHISTSYVERQNLTMRMSMRRFTRLTNGFSKKLENHAASVALHYMHYNFARVHQTLRVTPAMQAGLASHVWSIEEIVSLTERAESATAA